MKKLSIFAIALVLSATVFAQMPAMKRPMAATPQVRDYLKVLMFFKTVKNSREQLQLTEKQNVKLDKILRDVENYTQNLRKERQSDKFLENFVKDSFDPLKFQQEQMRKQEETRIFYLSKIKEIYDLLTVPQREKLVSIIKKQVKRLKKIKEMRKWRENQKRMK